MVLVPLIASTTGVLLSLVSSVTLASSDGSGADLAPYIGGVGNGIAVVGLVYVLRAVLSGNLIARPVAEVEAKLLNAVERGLEREDILEEIAGKMGFISATKNRRRS